MITFKQYLESKQQLIKAIEETPVSIIEYEVFKYCTLPTGETKEDAKLLPLKPKHKLIIEWRYDNVSDPSPQNIRVQGMSTIDDCELFDIFWSGQKLQKWLSRHARKGETRNSRS